MKAEFLTPVGRLVQGDPFEAQTKNMAGQPLVTKTGQPTQRYFIAVAFPKTDANFGAFYQKLVEVARASFPHLFNAQGQCTHPRFSFKLMDGDGVDDNGKPNNQKPGMAGCWIVKFSSSFAPRCFHAGRYQPHEQIQDPKAIPRGYYVRVAGTIEGNDDPNKPGLFVNLSMVELAGGQPSDIIVSGPDASAIFGGTAAQLPPGVAPAVLPATGAAMPGTPMQAAPVAAMPGMPVMGGAQPAAPLAMPGAAAVAPSQPAMSGMPVAAGPATTYPSSAPLAVQPNPGILVAGAAMAPAAGMPSLPAAPGVGAMPAAPSSFQMTAAAGGFTREQYHANGWTDDALRQAGFMV
jgi:hypothetical protein